MLKVYSYYYGSRDIRTTEAKENVEAEHGTGWNSYGK